MTTDRRILLVEDEPHIAEAIRFILTRAGWLVAVEPDGAAVLGRIRTLRPKVVVLDVMLPGRSGLDILTDLRTDPAFSTLPVLMLTARGHGRDREAAEQAGATAFLAKPFANADVLAAVERIAGADQAG